MTDGMTERPKKNSRILVMIDLSNFEYSALFSACGKWRTLYKEESVILRNADPENPPDLTMLPGYRKTLYKSVQDKLEYINFVLRKNHEFDLDMSFGVDVVFAVDDSLRNNFRKLRYPEYKAQRILRKKVFDVFKIKNYIHEVIFKDLELEEKFGYRILRVPDCESDDIIAYVMKNYDEYICKVIISSDKDFLQLEGVSQYDWKNRKIERKPILSRDDIVLEPKEFLLWKIINGDPSDNIKHVFESVGPVKSYELVKNREKLRSMLKEDHEAYNRFVLNKYLIDFNSIPKELEYNIKTEADKIMKSLDEWRNREFVINTQGCMEL